MQIRSRLVEREFESKTRPDLHAGTAPVQARKAILSVTANHKEKFSIMHIDVFHAYFWAKAQRSVLAMLPKEDMSKT